MSTSQYNFLLISLVYVTLKIIVGSVIKAWDIGVATMKKGEQAILTCASEYAYGKAGSPPNIPPDATLKFDVSTFCILIFLWAILVQYTIVN